MSIYSDLDRSAPKRPSRNGKPCLVTVAALTLTLLLGLAAGVPAAAAGASSETGPKALQYRLGSDSGLELSLEVSPSRQTRPIPQGGSWWFASRSGVVLFEDLAGVTYVDV